MRFLILAAVAGWLLLLLAGDPLPAVDDVSAHGPHVGVAVADHPHAGDGSVAHPQVGFAHAVLPRAATILAALALVLAVAGCVTLCGRGIMSAVRGPPGRHASVLAGQTLLIRICIARC